MLSCLSSKTWGWRKHSLTNIFLATQRSIMDYSAAGWQPWLSATQMDKLEVAQNKCLRIISGQYANSHRDSLHLETGISTYRSNNQILITNAYKKRMQAT